MTIEEMNNTIGEFLQYIDAAKRELGRFDMTGQPLADGVRAMRLELERCEHMIDGLVREIVTPNIEENP